jgi:hypothetical protein
MRIIAIGLLLVVIPAGACETKPPPRTETVSCKADADCVISCEKRDHCCDSPWCETVQHEAVAADTAAYNARECPKKKYTCPDYGARAKPDYTIAPRCKAGACVGEKIPNVEKPE